MEAGEFTKTIEMANCTSYRELTPKEKIEFIGKLVHLVQNDEISFSLANGMIVRGEVKGVFNDVKIFPYQENVQLTTID